MRLKLTSIVVGVLLSLLGPQAPGAEETPMPPYGHWLCGLRIGLLAHDVPLWSRSRSEGGIDLNVEMIFNYPVLALFSGTVYPHAGLSWNTRGGTSSLYSGLLWEYTGLSGIFFNLGLGFALHNGELTDNDSDRKALGSRLLFRIPVELGMSFAGRHGVSMLFVHISNAYLAEPNEGLDTIGLRYFYRF